MLCSGCVSSEPVILGQETRWATVSVYPLKTLHPEVRVRRDGIEYYRWQASHCRELADRQTNAEVKAQLLKVAYEYEQLAQHAPQQG